MDPKWCPKQEEWNPRKERRKEYVEERRTQDFFMWFHSLIMEGVDELLDVAKENGANVGEDLENSYRWTPYKQGF